jgi:hypothetical protein
MAGEAKIDVAALDEPAKTWRPSGSPAHRVDQPDDDAKIVEQQQELGLFGTIGRFFRRPFVRLVLGLGIFVFGAIVYDETVNFGEWTERKEKARATRHHGLEPIRQTPGG